MADARPGSAVDGAHVPLRAEVPYLWRDDGGAAVVPVRRVAERGVVSRGVGVERINPGELAPPSGFSHAVVASGGRLVFLAGQIALRPDGQIEGRSVTQQFEVALTNLLTALRAAGGGPGDLMSLTLYLVDMEDYRVHAREVGQVWRRLAGREYPAMAAVEVARLWYAEALVEVQGIAVVGA
jgi:enamine deaminase RidA (YjgF/YER057c/UK114 family)